MKNQIEMNPKNMQNKFKTIFSFNLEPNYYEDNSKFNKRISIGKKGRFHRII